MYHVSHISNIVCVNGGLIKQDSSIIEVWTMVCCKMFISVHIIMVCLIGFIVLSVYGVALNIIV
jgi:hypothetical protein